MADQAILNASRALVSAGDTVAAGAKAYFYETGTANLVTVYSDVDLTTAHASPVVADAAGVFAQVFYDGAVDLRVVVTASDDSSLYTLDPAPTSAGATGGAASISFTPTTEIPVSNVQEAIEQVQANIDAGASNAQTVTATTGSASAYILAATETISGYASGQFFRIRANHTNTGATTIDIDGLGTRAVQKYDGTGALVALAAGDIQQGQIKTISYDGTRFVLNGDALATETEPGVVEKATTAEMEAGTVDKFPSAAEVKTYVDGTLSTGTSGYKILPGGLVIQWGVTAVMSGTTTITFPIAFPNEVFCGFATVRRTGAIGGGGGIMSYFVDNSLTQADVTHDVISTSSNNPVMWIALGN